MIISTDLDTMKDITRLIPATTAREKTTTSPAITKLHIPFDPKLMPIRLFAPVSKKRGQVSLTKKLNKIFTSSITSPNNPIVINVNTAAQVNVTQLRIPGTRYA